jgi:hypothetical protein
MYASYLFWNGFVATARTNKLSLMGALTVRLGASNWGFGLEAVKSSTHATESNNILVSRKLFLVMSLVFSFF